MSNCKCPHCGGRIEVNLSAVSTTHQPRSGGGRASLALFQSSHRSVFRNDAAAPPMPGGLPAGFSAERQSPAFLPTKESNVIVPLLEALITGAFVGICTMAIVPFIDFRFGPYIIRGGFWNGLGWGGALFIGASFVQWIRLTGNYRNLLWRLETVSGVDVDNDGDIGQPAPPHKVQVQVEQGSRWQFEDLPGDAHALWQFADDVTNERVSFSEAGARKSGYGAENYGRLRDVFIKRGWAGWRDVMNRQQGVELYRNGRSVLKAISSDPPPEAQSDKGDDTDLGMSPHHVDKGTRRASWG
jgi:hypothetical protein